ncbi:flagellar assembly peptidoglycan hydrolase FlgJ [Chitiniphilus purpureus]|uniref:Peptidoglycan hydrolase FlgJ n=1 Tax=Chitiniphilus purpureus TaxID=2981137 RepID=A0ABY6DRR2_9NEIS|nr:flagellar assembly peptidoglycan hydrolase FlgJ [Chitiniphilus sp. CD1]UXY17017.1 flagellar assembly peptidoglycan hydrolase FlgJ [Chitiniphilus sp. CD1]
MLKIPASQPLRDFAADVRSADQLRLLNKQDAKAATREVARQFEALLVQQMLKSMREASTHFDESSNSSIDLFRGMYDQQLAQSWTRSGGTGLADAILRQIEVQTNPALLDQPRTGRAQLAVTAPVRQAAAAAANSAAPVAAATAKDAAAQFLDRIGNAAGPAAERLGVAPSLLVAHAALETGWGRKPIRDAAGNDSHNLFGIKAGGDWQGRTAEVTTTEFIHGVPQKRVERFRAYDSYAEAFADYAALIERRYQGALAQDAGGYGAALQAGGYATDPRYADKFTRVAVQVARLQDSSRIG